MLIKEIKVGVEVERKIYGQHGVQRAELEDALREGKPLFFKTKQPTMEEEITVEDLGEPVEFEIAESAFKGPFTCHDIKTQRRTKQMVVKSIAFSYEVWECPRCKREYLDREQAQRLEKIWLMEKLLQEKTIHFDRTINYDGKAFFFRFPKEITNHWHGGMKAHLELLTTNEFLVRIEEKTIPA
jgi:hypothetical protein